MSAREVFAAGVIAEGLWTVLGVTGVMPWAVAFPVIALVFIVTEVGLVVDKREQQRRAARRAQVQRGGPHSVNVQAGRDITADQADELRAKLQESLKHRDPVILPPLTEAVRSDPYVPEGQGELSASLLELLWEQVREADAHRIGPQLAWHVSPEWLNEIRKIQLPDGKPAWAPRRRVVPPGKLHAEFLYGYPVVTSEEFGVPELRKL